MNNSIESMWKEGFLKNEALVAPQVNDIYNQKSQNIIDQIKERFAMNLKGIIIAAFVLLVGLSLLGFPFLGIYLAAMFMYLVSVSYRHSKELKHLNKNDNSYQYLKSFDDAVKGMMDQYIEIYRYFYPMLFIGCMTSVLSSDTGQEGCRLFLSEFTSMPAIFGVPVLFIAVIGFIAFLLSYYAKTVYLADVDTVYGRQFAKVTEILQDMESLQKEVE